MTTIENETGATPKGAPVLTFKGRLAQARRKLEEDAIFDLEVPWYENLWARYRVLGFEELRAIGMRVEDETDDPVTAERLTAAETLAEACSELLEYKGHDDDGKPILESLGYRWTSASARDLFDVELPEGVIAREAILAIFPYPRDMLMMQHFNAFIAEGMNYMPEVEKALSGESRAALAAITSDS